MVATDLDLGLDFNDLEREEARANRPSFNHNAICWEGDLVSITPGQDVNEKTGEVFPRHAFNFEKVKFIDVGNAVGEFTDGQSYTLLIRPVTEEQKAKRTTRFTEMGKSALASGKGLEKFLHQRVKVTELSETYKARDTGYDRQSYAWKFETIAGGGVGPTKLAEIPEELVTAALAFIGAGSYKESNVGLALMKEATTNSNTTLNGKYADGSFVKEHIQSGRIVTDEAGILSVIN